MRSPIDHFDSETLALMGRVCDDAWNELQKTIFFPTQLDASDVRSRLAARVLEAASQGERSPDRLKSIALEAAEA
jgi:hypothetical protein